MLAIIMVNSDILGYIGYIRIYGYINGYYGLFKKCQWVNNGYIYIYVDGYNNG